MLRRLSIPLAACMAACMGALTGCMAPIPGIAPAPGSWQAIGRSREGRALEAATFGAGAQRVYIVGGIHGDEPEGQAVVAQLEQRLVGRATPATVRIVRDMNPDGTAAGRRGNSEGVDLNRNWPAANFRAAGRRGEAPLSEPETAAAHADMIAFGPEIIVVLHSIRSGPFVNFDGPGATLAATFATAAAGLDGRWRVVADMGYATPGSMGSFWGVDRDTPILTIEMARGEDSAAVVMAAVAGIEAIVASGFRPMEDVLACSSARSPVLTPIARKGDAAHGASP